MTDSADIVENAPELGELRRFAARIGRNALHIQGAGGNVSWKSSDVLWVKASGTRLMDAETAPCLAAVDLQKARQLAAEDAPDLKAAALDNLTPGLRPSIETAMHAVLPQAVVCHTHAVDVLAHVCSADGVQQLLRRLEDAGEPAALVDYARPGAALARALMNALSTPAPDVYILMNHGLVVCGNDVAEVEARLTRVDAAMALPVQPAGLPPPEVAAPEGWRWRSEPGLRRLAELPALSSTFGPESFWPDHAVFLGPADPGGRWDIRGDGVCTPDDLTDGEEAMVTALALVMERIDAAAELRPLPPGEAEALGNWEAEKHRKQLDAQASRQTDTR